MGYLFFLPSLWMRSNNREVALQEVNPLRKHTKVLLVHMMAKCNWRGSQLMLIQPRIMVCMIWKGLGIAGQGRRMQSALLRRLVLWQVLEACLQKQLVVFGAQNGFPLLEGQPELKMKLWLELMRPLALPLAEEEHSILTL
jgi:hypothetical protein